MKTQETSYETYSNISAEKTDEDHSMDWTSFDPERFIQNNHKFSSLMMRYRCAIREVQTKLEVLDDEFSIAYNRNPISSIHTRIKRPASIYRKLQRLGYDFTPENIEEQLNDVSGVRVVCPFIDDIYKVGELLTKQDDIEVLQIKDYIKNPKPNGYRSYHMIIQVPVFFSKGKKPMRVEVQIRTIGMDFWASLEHQLRYKKDLDEIDSGIDVLQISDELRKSAQTISEMDVHMQSIKEMIGKFYTLD